MEKMDQRELNETERILFAMTKEISDDRLEYQDAMAMSWGKKKERSRLKHNFLRTKELALEELIIRAGLKEQYDAWAWGK